MRLQERDYKILKISYEHGFIHQRHVQRLFPNYTEMRRRIVEMKRAGYIEEILSDATGKPILRHTRLGAHYAEYKTYGLFPGRRRQSPFLYFHEMKVISVRMRLEELWMGRWIPERAFRGFRKDVPDGIFHFASGKEIYIEVENSLKSRDNFVRKFNRYDGTNAILILYVASTQTIYNGIKRYLSEIQNPGAIYGLISFDDLIKQKPEVWNKTHKLAAFLRKEF